MTLDNGTDKKIVLLEDKIEFYSKDKKWAELKTDYVKAKHYKLKQLCNKIFKTKFKLEVEKSMLYVLDEEIYKMIERNK